MPSHPIFFKRDLTYHSLITKLNGSRLYNTSFHTPPSYFLSVSIVQRRKDTSQILQFISEDYGPFRWRRVLHSGTEWPEKTGPCWLIHNQHEWQTWTRDAGLMLDQRHRRWAIIKPTLGQPSNTIIAPMLVQCWPSVVDDGSTLNQHCDKKSVTRKHVIFNQCWINVGSAS